ncbi:MAG: AAA family ATPase [Patescibacteria group bacterium]
MAESSGVNRIGPRGDKAAKRLTYGGIPFDPNKEKEREAQLSQHPSVAEIIRKRKADLSDELKEKDEELKENTPLQVVERMREAIRDTQAARGMIRRAVTLLAEAKQRLAQATKAKDREATQLDVNFYTKQKHYWTARAAVGWAEMYTLKETYGPGLEAAHREYAGDFVEFVHFKKKFAELTAVERAIANYQPDLMGQEETKDAKSKRLQGIVAEALSDEPMWTTERFLENVPAYGQEEEMSAEGTNILEVFQFVFGAEKATEVAKEMQDHFQQHDEEEAEALKSGSEAVLDIRGMSLAELKAKQQELLGTCEEKWEHPAVQSMWFEQNLHEMILARLREDRVLELPLTIKLLNRIAQMERNHPNTTVGVALVGDPGVGKTTVVEHYLRKKGRSYVYIDMTEEVTRYTLLGSPAVHTESQLDFYRRMSEEFGELADADIEAMVTRNAEKLQKGFGSLSVEEQKALSLSMLHEELQRAGNLQPDAEFKQAFDKEVVEVRNSQPDIKSDQAQAEALQRLQAKIEDENPEVTHLIARMKTQVLAKGGPMDEAQLRLAAQTEALKSFQDVHTAGNMDESIKGKLQHAKEALSRVARMKYQDEAAEKFADLTKKNGWRDGLVIHALRTGKSILFDEYNAARDWKLLHHLFTLKPGDTYIFGDKAGEEIKIPDDWRMYFTGNIQLKHGVSKLKEALVSRIGGQVLTVEPPPAHEEWLVTIASLSDANDRLVRDEKDMVQLGFLVNNLFPKIREALRNAGSPNIVPISFRMIGNIAEQLMNHSTQFARPTSVDRAVIDEMVSPYRNYPDTIYPVRTSVSIEDKKEGAEKKLSKEEEEKATKEKEASAAAAVQTPSLIVKYLLEAGMLLNPEVEDEVIGWTGISKDELEKKREARQGQDWHKLMKEIQSKLKDTMTEMGPLISMV